MKNYFKSDILFLLCTLCLTACQASEKKSESINNNKSAIENLPFQMEAIKQPQIPDKEVNITDFGAIGDGVTDNTKAINEAIATLSKQGGGKVVISSGVWLTGPIKLANKIDLHLESNALVIFSPDYKMYPIVKISFEGIDTRRCISPISADSLSDIAITGEGIFEGSGDAWRPVKKEKFTENQWKNLVASGGILDEKGKIWYPSASSLKGSQASEENFNNPKNIKSDAEWESIHQWLRPVMLSISNCKNILLEDVTFRNSPSWGLHPILSTDLTIKNVKVFNPWYAQNGDGIDVESCNRVMIEDCFLDVGDDGLCIKSGKDKAGRDRGVPCQNVLIVNNTVLHGHGGFVVGSEMSGGVNNIYVKNCTFAGTDVGLRFKSARGRGGVVKNIWIEDINMTNIATEALLFDLFYGGKSAPEALDSGESNKKDTAVWKVTEETPAFRDIYIKNVYCKGARRAMFFNGLPEMKIQNVNIKDVTISATTGAEIVNADNVKLDNVRVIPKSGEPFIVQNSSKVDINGKILAEK